MIASNIDKCDGYEHLSIQFSNFRILFMQSGQSQSAGRGIRTHDQALTTTVTREHSLWGSISRQLVSSLTGLDSTKE